MLISLPSQLRRASYAVCSNTKIEPPHIDSYLKSAIAHINRHAKNNQIPFKIIEVSPAPNDEFWVNLIGRGYPSPTRTFRWCTERLKINPTKQTIANIVAKHGQVVLCLGVRKDESQNRKKSIERRELSELGFF